MGARQTKKKKPSLFLYLAAAVAFVSFSNIILPHYADQIFTPKEVPRTNVNTSQEKGQRERESKREIASPNRITTFDTIKKSNGIKCDDNVDDCRGFFQYSGPNISPRSTQLLKAESDAYTYGTENNTDGVLGVRYLGWVMLFACCVVVTCLNEK